MNAKLALEALKQGAQIEEKKQPGMISLYHLIHGNTRTRLNGRVVTYLRKTSWIVVATVDHHKRTGIADTVTWTLNKSRR